MKKHTLIITILIIIVLAVAIFSSISNDKKTTDVLDEIQNQTQGELTDDILVPDQLGDESVLPNAASFTLAEVAMHAGADSCYTAIGGEVFDLTSFIKKHPGGAANILKICGKDGTSLFTNKHGGSPKPEETLDGFKIGDLVN